MKQIRYAVIAAALIGCIAGNFSHPVAQDPNDQATNAMVQRMDQFMTRAKLICQEMERQGVSKQRCQRLKQMAEGVGTMAQQVKTIMQQTQELQKDEYLMADEQIERDVLAVRAQLGQLASYMDNVLQYLEHLTYRYGKL